MTDKNSMVSQDVLLVNEIRQLIDKAKQRATGAVNAVITLLYW